MCAALSKLSRCQKERSGIMLPGESVNPRITSAQSIAAKLYLKNIFSGSDQLPVCISAQ